MAWIKRTADGLVIGKTGEKVAFNGATPVVKRAGSAQAALDAVAATAPAATAATSTTPFGYSEAQANDIVTLVTELRTQAIANYVLVNEIRAALIAVGLIKGAA